VSEPLPGRFRFGLYEFDVTTRELRREGVLIRLQSQPALVLGCLLERAGKMVSREELHQAVWGGETFVDFERGLNFCISQVRAALREDSAEPTYIRTLPRQGYQFIAPIERISGLPAEGQMPAAAGRNLAPTRWMAVLLVAGILVGIAVAGAKWWEARQSAEQVPIVAVLRFDNETDNPEIARFSDGLTDTVIEQLTSAGHGHYSVIGNAQILRAPREQRDLRSIATSLHAAYVILGQVQSNGAEVRILAHLIRLPDQTHVRVVRMDRALVDALSLESEAARKIAEEFSPRVSERGGRAASAPPATP
jgi:DNA-binding winged helix-turn-helix (wHTH) protein/TolB-like protein